MNVPEDDANELVDNIRDVVGNERTAELKAVEGRVTESDANEGVSVVLTGGYIPVRPIIEYIATVDDWKIENIGIIPDAEQTECPGCDREQFHSGVNVFCAYVGDVESELSNVFTH